MAVLCVGREFLKFPLEPTAYMLNTEVGGGGSVFPLPVFQIKTYCTDACSGPRFVTPQTYHLGNGTDPELGHKAPVSWDLGTVT